MKSEEFVGGGRHLPLLGEGQENLTNEVHLSRVSCRKKKLGNQKTEGDGDSVQRGSKGKIIFGKEEERSSEGLKDVCEVVSSSETRSQVRAMLGRLLLSFKNMCLGNHLSSLSQKFRTTLVNLKAFSVVEIPSETVTTNNY